MITHTNVFHTSPEYYSWTSTNSATISERVLAQGPYYTDKLINPNSLACGLKPGFYVILGTGDQNKTALLDSLGLDFLMANREPDAFNLAARAPNTTVLSKTLAPQRDFDDMKKHLLHCEDKVTKLVKRLSNSSKSTNIEKSMVEALVDDAEAELDLATVAQNYMTQQHVSTVLELDVLHPGISFGFDSFRASLFSSGGAAGDKGINNSALVAMGDLADACTRQHVVIVGVLNTWDSSDEQSLTSTLRSKLLSGISGIIESTSNGAQYYGRATYCHNLPTWSRTKPYPLNREVVEKQKQNDTPNTTNLFTTP